MRLGHRLALVYNLILQGPGQPPSAAAATSLPVMAAAPGEEGKVQRVAALLRTWLDEEPAPKLSLPGAYLAAAMRSASVL